MATSCPLSASTYDHHLIAGTAVDPGSARRLSVTSPLDGQEIGSIPLADAALIERAVEAAATAGQDWAATPIKARVQPLYRFKQLVEAHSEALAELCSRESGKTRAEAAAGIAKGLEVVEYACSLPNIAHGELLEVSRGVDCQTRRYPLGVVAGITPFNFPAMVPLWMIPLAIASGNTFIHKPSEQTPQTPLMLAELLREAGLPDGVYNVLHGDRSCVEALLDHPLIAAAAFVGSTAVARQVYLRGVTAGKRMLALGGAKNHIVLMPDADPELTAANVVASAFGCAGQRCMAASALLAVGDCDAVIERIVAIAAAIRLGEDMGAVISAAAKERIEGYIGRAAASGAQVRLDGRDPQGAGPGYWVGPTILDELAPDHEALRDEIFGPVLSIARVPSLDAALAIEQACPYGNAASIFTRDGATARLFEQRASAGMIGINIGVPVPREPFGFGGWNASAFGQGDITGRAAVDFWTRTKKCTTKWAAHAASNWMS